MILMVGVVADFAARVNSKLWDRYCTLLIDGLSARGEQSEMTVQALTASELAMASALW